MLGDFIDEAAAQFRVQCVIFIAGQFGNCDHHRNRKGQPNVGAIIQVPVFRVCICHEVVTSTGYAHPCIEPVNHDAAAFRSRSRLSLLRRFGAPGDAARGAGAGDAGGAPLGGAVSRIGGLNPSRR